MGPKKRGPEKQGIALNGNTNRVNRGYNGARNCNNNTPSNRNTNYGFRPRLVND